MGEVKSAPRADDAISLVLNGVWERGKNLYAIPVSNPFAFGN